MKKILLLIPLVLSVILFSGFKTRFDFAPVVENDNQQVISVNGNKAIVSSLNDVKIGIFGFVEIHGDLVFNIFIQNLIDTPINFSPKNVNIIATDTENRQKTLILYNNDEFERKAIEYGFYTVYETNWPNLITPEIKRNYDTHNGLIKNCVIQPKEFIAGYLPFHYYDERFWIARIFTSRAYYISRLEKINNIIISIPIKNEVHKIKFAIEPRRITDIK